MKFQGTYLIIFAFAIAAYYIYLGVRILRKKIFIQKSAITDYITALILVPLFINSIIVFIKDKFYVYKASWIFLIMIFIITAFYVTSVILGFFTDEYDIYNAPEEKVKEALEAAAKKLNINFSAEDNKYVFNSGSETGKAAGADINKYKVPEFVKLTVNKFKNIDNYNEFFKEFKDTLMLQDELKSPHKKAYLFYFIAAAALIAVGIAAIMINTGHLWV